MRVTEIRPHAKAGLPDWSELWDRRELLGFLVWRDLKVRYRQTLLGAAWALLQPFLAMAVFTIFFGRLAHMPSDNVPYPLFAFCALVPWLYFANALSGASMSLVEHRHLLTRVRLPLPLLPAASVIGGLVDLAIGLLALGLLMAYYGRLPGSSACVLPLFLLLAVFTSFGLGLWLSALNARYRDVRHALPFMLQVWMFATPVAYPSSLVPEPWRPLYALNPMVGTVEGFRWALLGTPPPSLAMLIASAAAVALLLLGGLVYFGGAARTLADVV